ncbi:iron-containing alcohol dehydrogenase [Leptospira levettii]|uniref:AroB-related putative sugar phosphate phospholyase (cyclizing) n=1 Tax=Leptospira levettii TaxID=2023178 RepID=UPI00108321B1|nr:AroB-related putative sugar phosphate phospholyase (cyclizing) [Leptospira levettii]TGM94158.1 iron-containing alcohol dehydrogenase [Leptospira levettii]
MFEYLKIQSILRSYSVYFSGDTDQLISELKVNNTFFLVDRNVHEKFLSGLLHAELKNVILIEANELNKTPDFCLSLIELMVENNIKKSSKLVAIGGGVIQDITSFIASILFRGIDWIFFPTTLLAQADSCIGSKSSINFNLVKNLLGTFNPPSEIYINTKFLNTLSESDIKSGIGEIFHYYYYKNSDYISRMVSEYHRILADRSLIEPYIQESLSIKKEMVERDEFDKGPRRVFNYGHTFGHALEALTDYYLNHGQAVTIGMDLANFISLNLGFINQLQYDVMRKELEINFPNFRFPLDSFDKYLQLLSKDKKNTNENVTCILTKGKGDLFLYELVFNENNKALVRNYFTSNFA